ncbi:hypothetical protein NDU88_006606 [Pleurodeles waltl]|uniref:Uncharacterized protein n=1 Tax=Pleurodeles waltl TaxID=8319 RepID=A0AAV7TXB0_PLEWA|nr:hypothetical protein NDU88_006606 [Pleurodeles waltl]
MVHLNWRGDDKTITVGMIPNLGEDLILSTDYVNFTPLLEKACQEHINNAWWEEAPFGTSEMEARTQRKKLSRKQKREQRREHRNSLTLKIPAPTLHTAKVFTAVGNFRQAQREDPTLKNAWQQALHPDGQSIRHSPGSLMTNADYLSRYLDSERLYQPHAMGSVCDGPARCGPSVNTTCAGTAESNPALKDEAANPRELPASKEEPGGFHASGRTDEKTNGREEGGCGSSRSTGERRFDQRQEPGGGCLKRFAASSAAQEAHCETSSHASGEAWHTQVRPETG